MDILIFLENIHLTFWTCN